VVRSEEETQIAALQMRRSRRADSCPKADAALQIEANGDKSHGIKDIKILGELVWIMDNPSALLYISR
jgi:hypothetical protein